MSFQHRKFIQISWPSNEPLGSPEKKKPQGLSSALQVQTLLYMHHTHVYTCKYIYSIHNNSHRHKITVWSVTQPLIWPIKAFYLSECSFSRLSVVLITDPKNWKSHYHAPRKKNDCVRQCLYKLVKSIIVLILQLYTEWMQWMQRSPIEISISAMSRSPQWTLLRAKVRNQNRDFTM